MPRVGIAESDGKFLFSLCRNSQTVFQMGYSIFCSHQSQGRPHFPQSTCFQGHAVPDIIPPTSGSLPVLPPEIPLSVSSSGTMSGSQFFLLGPQMSDLTSQLYDHPRQKFFTHLCFFSSWFKKKFFFLEKQYTLAMYMDFKTMNGEHNQFVFRVLLLSKTLLRNKMRSRVKGLV